MRCKEFDLKKHGALFEGGGLYAIRKFYMGDNSRGGLIRRWWLNRGFKVINFSSLYHTYFFCSIFCSSSSRLYIHFHIITGVEHISTNLKINI